MSPSDKARFHAVIRTPSPSRRNQSKDRLASDNATSDGSPTQDVCMEMSRLDPHYVSPERPINPFESILRYV